MNMDEPCDNMDSCESCETENELVFCTGCNLYYCEPCWDKRKTHKDKTKLGPGGIPHEKVHPAVVKRVEGCMAEPESPADERQQHEDDQEATWFGLERDLHGDPVLSEYRRYASIMMEAASKYPTTTAARHPALVSFMGQTGAGKSTLIRLLINPTRDPEDENDSAQPTCPVIGRSECEVPTSSDVHLYADPETFASDRPILLADCEGFDGGERDPIASGGGTVEQPLQRISRKPISKPGRNLTARIGRTLANKVVSPRIPGTRHILRWARRDAPNFEETSKRQYAVTEMYPRIFYAFSDVIVFVMNNPNTMEGVIEQLLKWADANYSKCINIPSKPHAIIALNKCPNSTPDVRWSHLYSRDEMFRQMNAQIHKNPTFQKYVNKWREARKMITGMEDLFNCYYSSVHVIRFPDKSRYHLLDQQRSELYNLIDQCQGKSLEAKKQRHVLPDVDEFGLYMSLAIEHFSNTLEEPFDYVKASLKYQPPPVTMADNLSVFVDLVAERMSIPGEIESLFTKLVNMVASSFLLESVRKRLFGQPENWFQADMFGNPQETEKRNRETSLAVGQDGWTSYETICKSVIHKYFEQKVACSYNIGLYQCGQYKFSHEPVHRVKKRFRTIESSGRFEHSFNELEYKWDQRVLARIEQLQSSLTWTDNTDPRGARARAHRITMRPFYDTLIGGEGIFCNSVCLCCLFNPPDFQLACGHIICLECAKDFGRFVDGTRLIMDECPIHGGRTMSEQGVLQTTTIDLDPAHSGLRVLTLDGGGVRGIVELSVLKALENRIGVPIQRFFDLVVGTSTGGIVALGFGHELWPVEECIRKFKDVVKQAFTLRQGQEVHGIKQLQLLHKKSKYQTKPLEDALKSAFSDTSLFGSQQKEGSRRLRVAVTAVSECGQKPWVISNYNACNMPKTTDEKHDSYSRHRPTRREEEFKVWEAARGTSAAPGFFKPFAKNGPAKANDHHFPELMDGALRHNNPIYVAMEESRRLAATHSQVAIPDIVISLGTGLSKKSYGDIERSPFPGLLEAQQENGSRRKSFLYRTFMPFFAIVKYQIKLNLDSEERWRTWSEPLLQGPASPWRDRLYRINPDLGDEPPELDDVPKVQPMENNVGGWLNGEKRVRQQLDEVACTLVASSFYFERSGKAATLPHESGIRLSGHIRCRIRDDVALMGLGAFLSTCHSPAKFVVEGVREGAAGDDGRLALPVAYMRDHGKWEDVPAEITIQSEETSTRIALDLLGIVDGRRLFSLSGFPRQLMHHDFKPNQGG